ncbi:MAG: hypothetical protein HY840_00505, partial [Bacteroidetes bacterium]|nr:hypothetical protein [Bacteroidota bacterium]
NWLTKITNADALPSDETVEDELMQLSATVEEKMELCRHKFQGAKFFIEKTFPDNFAVQNEFGYDDYEGARQNQAKMIGFMENFYRVAKKYKVKLIAKNYTMPMIDEIGTLRDALRTADNDQEAFKSGRPVLTQDRIIILNACWIETLKVCSAGKIIFHNNLAKYNQYLLPDSGGTVPTPPPALALITLTTDQTILQAIILKIAGNALATGTEQFKIAFGDGNETIGTLANGILASYPHDYNIPGADASGIYTITITPVTAGAFALMGILQFDNCKLMGIVTIPAAVQASGIQTPNNHITNFNMQPASYSKLTSLVLFNNDMTASNVNFNMIGLDDNGLPNGFANFGGGNAAPTGAGITAKNNLIAKGWTVITN